MKRIQITDDLSFSSVIHGLWRLNEWGLSTKELQELMEWNIEQGITTFDHADIYGSYTCEELFGKVLKEVPSLRKKMEIVTKCGIVLPSENRPAHKTHHYNTSKTHIIASVERSLLNLHTDYIDTLLIHRPDPLMDPAEMADAFNTLHKQGKVRTFGVSNFKPRHLRMLSSHMNVELVTNQVEVSAYQLENIWDGTLDYALEKKMPIMVWSPLAGGKIFTSSDAKAVRIREATKKIASEIDASSIDEALYAWIYQHPCQVMPITGSHQKHRIQAALKGSKYTLTRDQWFEILHASMGHDVP
ncbi:aldo/keto reductase family oxidoreductase [Alteribacillus sp. YIM 98480]|uniref:aldo/keto reductase n=1 Tax=Alteribacillus sp. YIM 98480 TaxID=2606599 RepID=UPI00131ACC21|nr:aldo/keto reductase [Alteribacillus sp. YIM 98480]